MNEFSAEWYRIFLDPIGAELTRSEVEFVARQLPPAEFPALLDVACGPGRHAAALVARGYRVLGVDVNPDAIARARVAVPRGAEFRALDMRELGSLAERFDGVTNLWHSFGYFDDAANERVLQQMRERLRPGGRLLLDVYNRAHFAPMPPEETSERNGERDRDDPPLVGQPPARRAPLRERRRHVRVAALHARGARADARVARLPRADRLRVVPRGARAERGARAHAVRRRARLRH